MVHGMHRIPVHCDVHLCLCTLSYLLDAQECLIYYANVHLNAMPCHADVVDLAQGAPAKCHSSQGIRYGPVHRNDAHGGGISQILSWQFYRWSVIG